MFLVHSTFRPPTDLKDDDIAELNRRESNTALRLQREGMLLQLWREVGTRNAWGIWNADSGEQLAEVLATLPWSPQMTFESFPIVPHPNAIDRATLDQGGDS